MAQLAQSDIWDNRHDLYTILEPGGQGLQEHETYPATWKTGAPATS